MEQAIWCIAIFAKSRPKTFLKLNVLEVIIHNSCDEYEPASDHVMNSPDAAAAVCHGLSTLIQELGEKAMEDFDYCDGPQITCKILDTHSSVEPVCANGCQLISNVLMVKPGTNNLPSLLPHPPFTSPLPFYIPTPSHYNTFQLYTTLF